MSTNNTGNQGNFLTRKVPGIGLPVWGVVGGLTVLGLLIKWAFAEKT